MSFYKRMLPLKVLALTASLFFSAWSAHAESGREEKGGVDERSRGTDETKAEKVDDVTLLRSKVDQLQLLVGAQQRALTQRLALVANGQ